LRPEALVNLFGKPILYLSLRARSFDFQKVLVADEPIGAASHRGSSSVMKPTLCPAFEAGSGYLQSDGLREGIDDADAGLSKSARLRVTTLESWTRAVAAIRLS
jgi:hypothetical protein